MKAIQYNAYGNSEVIQLNQIDKPIPKENEVLIRITATTVNPLDMKIREGYLQKQMPVTFPYVPGMDVAGTIEESGSSVSRFKAGDLVFANKMGGGTYAEYASFPEDKVSLIPSSISQQEAAALAIPLATSYSILVENSSYKQGERLLIQGAAGAVGLVLVQMAKAMGIYVIATASGDGVALVKSLGADEVIDYKSQDFTTLVKDIDVVADLAGGEAQNRLFEVIKKNGLLISTFMPPSEDLAKKYNITAKFLNMAVSAKELEYGKALVEKGKIKAHIVKIFDLEEAAQAQDLVSAGGIRGKVLLKI